MYKFPYYTEQDPEKVIAFMKDYSFAMITGFGEPYPVATHIPLEIEVQEDGRILLSGHLMKKTDHHLAFEKNNNVLVIFNAPIRISVQAGTRTRSWGVPGIIWQCMQKERSSSRMNRELIMQLKTSPTNTKPPGVLPHLTGCQKNMLNKW